MNNPPTKNIKDIDNKEIDEFSIFYFFINLQENFFKVSLIAIFLIILLTIFTNNISDYDKIEVSILVDDSNSQDFFTEQFRQERVKEYFIKKIYEFNNNSSNNSQLDEQFIQMSDFFTLFSNFTKEKAKSIFLEEFNNITFLLSRETKEETKELIKKIKSLNGITIQSRNSGNFIKLISNKRNIDDDIQIVKQMAEYINKYVRLKFYEEENLVIEKIKIELGLINNLYSEMLDIESQKVKYNNKNLISYLKEHQQIAKLLDIENVSSEQKSITETISNLAGKQLGLDYLRGYEALSEEISILNNRDIDSDPSKYSTDYLANILKLESIIEDTAVESIKSFINEIRDNPSHIELVDLKYNNIETKSLMYTFYLTFVLHFAISFFISYTSVMFFTEFRKYKQKNI
tara:strand:+ start:428 stop:1636 length:1209 start_codon:yes stop_codon:yes gene_type:complete